MFVFLLDVVLVVLLIFLKSISEFLLILHRCNLILHLSSALLRAFSIILYMVMMCCFLHYPSLSPDTESLAGLTSCVSIYHSLLLNSSSSGMTFFRDCLWKRHDIWL